MANNIVSQADVLRAMGSSMNDQTQGLLISVAESLLRMELTAENAAYIIKNRDVWASFGKMNSHIYRTRLENMLEQAGVGMEGKLMVKFFFSVIKNQKRVSDALKLLPPDVQAKTWYNEVRNFVDVHVTQYVSNVETSNKFPAVNIPNCNPGLDMLFYVLFTHPNERSVADMSTRPTFCQLNLDPVLQEEARDGYRVYWDVIVTGSKNPDAVPKNLEVPQFREEYYNTSAGDMYNLVGLDLKEIEPADPDLGYTAEELYNYVKSIDPANEFEEARSKMFQEMAVFRRASRAL